jgi:hypothetical protein
MSEGHLTALCLCNVAVPLFIQSTSIAEEVQCSRHYARFQGCSRFQCAVFLESETGAGSQKSLSTSCMGMPFGEDEERQRLGESFDPISLIFPGPHFCWRGVVFCLGV